MSYYDIVIHGITIVISNRMKRGKFENVSKKKISRKSKKSRRDREKRLRKKMVRV